MRVMLLNPPSKHSKNVVRDLVYGCWCKGKRIASAKFPPLGLLYIAAVLEKNGHDVILLDSQAEDKGMEDVKKIIMNKQPEVIVSLTSTMSFLEDCNTFREIKENVDVTTILYGSHVTFLPKISLEHQGVDFIVMGEPEYIIRDFINAKEKNENYKKIRGIGYRENGKTKINPRYPFIENLDELPFPNRKHILQFAYFNPLVKRVRWTTASTSRGCIGRCNFCTSPSFYGKVLRMRSPENVVKELEEIKEIGYDEVFFRDETFTANQERLKKICSLILEKHLNIDWICNARIGTVNKETMEMMKKAGCYLIKFGVESGVQQILDNINKGIRVDMTRKTFKWAHEVGMETHAHIMLGCIGETKNTISETIKFVKEIKPTTVTFGAFTPYPGTEVFEMVRKKEPAIGDGSSCDLSKIHTIGFYNYLFCDLNEEEIGDAIVRAYKEFYLRPSYIMEKLISVRSPAQLRKLLFAGLDVLSFVRNKN
jgi:anaerobic magnesium-protoporphyrin IX monomethyl ester cyclase